MSNYIGEAVSVRAVPVLEALGMVGVNIPVYKVPKNKSGQVTVRSLKTYLAGLEVGQDLVETEPGHKFRVIGHNHTGFTPEEVVEFVRSINPYDEFPADGGGENPLKINGNIGELAKQLGRAYAHFILTGDIWSLMLEWDGREVPKNHAMLRREGEGEPRQIHVWVDQNRMCRVRELEIGKGTGKWFWHPIAKRVRNKIQQNRTQWMDVICLTKFHFLATMLGVRDGSSIKTGIRIVGGRWGKMFREGLLSETVRLSGLDYHQIPLLLHVYGKI